MTDPKLIQYAVWDEPENGDPSYWLLHDSLSDAVGEYPQEIYRLKATRLGVFKKAQKVIRVKKRKRRAKK